MLTLFATIGPPMIRPARLKGIFALASKLDIHQIPAGPLETNAFLVVVADTKQALLIDAPPESHDAVMTIVRDHDVTVDTIILTHTHWDHIVDTNAFRVSLRAPVHAHSNADARLARPGSAVMDLPYTIEPITSDGHLDDGDEVAVGEQTFAVMHLPGHDPSHIVLYNVEAKVLLGGDVLFPGGHGRTDVPGADQDTMLQSLARLLELPDDVTVYPGHGQPTTIGAERGWMTEMTASVR
jgi:glyoxylase-like metal-dependent hydrolase (beta-lactamase superfamily II)